MQEILVGGFLALAGTLVGYGVHFLTACIERRERKNDRLRAKFEELCESTMNSIEQFQQMLGEPGTSATSSSHPTAPLKAHYLALVYFPELRDATREYSNAISLFRKFLFSECLNPSHPATLGAQAVNHPDFLGRVQEVHILRAKLENAIEHLSSQYAKT